MISGGALPSNVSLSYGLDEDKPDSPKVGAIYVAEDSAKTYVCYAAGVWSEIKPTLNTLLSDIGKAFLETEQASDTLVAQLSSFAFYRTITNVGSFTNEVINYTVPSGVTQLTFNGNINHNNDYSTYFMGYDYSINGGGFVNICWVCTTVGTYTVSPFILPVVESGDIVIIRARDGDSSQGIGDGYTGNAYLRATKIRSYSIVDA